MLFRSYPALRFAGVSEEKISPHLYLKWNGSGALPDIAPQPPRLIAKHQGMTVDELIQLQVNRSSAPSQGNGSASPFRVLEQKR